MNGSSLMIFAGSPDRCVGRPSISSSKPECAASVGHAEYRLTVGFRGYEK